MKTKIELIKDARAYKKLAVKYYFWYYVQLQGSRCINCEEVDARVKADFKALRSKEKVAS